MKIACLGAGGRYFTRPIGDIALCPDLHGADIALYDIDRDRADLMAGAARRFSGEAGARLNVSVASGLAEAVEGADFVLASIGGAGSPGAHGYYHSPVHVNDCILCARHGVFQIIGDTAGPAAMAAAFRSVSIYLGICREIERRAPRAILLNHANPMAVLCRAMVKHSAVRGVIGICHGVQGGIQHAAEMLGADPADLDAVWIGTNHYYWFLRLDLRGRDMLPELLRIAGQKPPPPGRRMCYDLSRLYGHWIVYPDDSHVVEFYPFLSQVASAERLPYDMAASHHGREMMPYFLGQKTIEDLRREDQATSRQEMLREYSRELGQVKLPASATHPLLGEGTARLMADISRGRRSVHILNVPNQGAVPNLPAEAVLEVECVSDSRGVRPVCMGQAPPALEALLRRRIAWQEAVAEAAVRGDRRLALEAMMLDEGALPPDRATALLEDLLANSKGMLPQFGLG
jgi:alpha-galactosidase